MATNTDLTKAGVSNPSRPYAASWFDSLNHRVARLPVPSVVLYAALGIFLVILVHLFAWQFDVVTPGQFNSFIAWLAFEIAYIMWLMSDLDARSAQALVSLRPLLNTDEIGFGGLQYELTHMPAGLTLVVSAAGILFGIFVFFAGFIQAAGSGIPVMPHMQVQETLILLGVLFAITWLCFGVLLVHTFRQLRLISQIYDHHTRVNLFDLGPLYAFSGVTARTAIYLLLLNYLWGASNPALSDLAVSTVTGIAFGALAFIVFASPFNGIHKQLVQAKQHLLAENSIRIQTTAESLYKQIDDHTFQNGAAMRDSLTALDIHAKALDKIPTWPWEPGMPRTVLTAILFPIIVFLIQFVIQKFLVP